MSDFKAKIHQIQSSAGAPSQNPVEEELTVLPQMAVWLSG